MSTPALLVATRKGAFFLRSTDRRSWSVEAPQFHGHVINHAVLDPRDGRTMLLGARTGHLGPTLFRSTDQGRTWKEAARPPAFPKSDDPKARAVDSVFWLTPGHASTPGVWYAGTTPHGLFRSEDGGDSWAPVTGFSSYYETIRERAGIGETPGGAMTHSVMVDVRDPKRLYVGLSGGGFFCSNDEGASWTPFNKGVETAFLPMEEPEVGHDPHCVVQHPKMPDRLWQQNHCGIYRVDRPAERWTRIGNAMPKEVGDIGFPIVLHPKDVDTAWVIPMDGTTVWPRTSPGGKPAVYRTRDAGKSWERQDHGFPRAGWWTVFRQAFAADDGAPAGLAFGTTSGEVWTSDDEGASWANAAAHLPAILAVTATRLD